MMFLIHEFLYAGVYCNTNFTLENVLFKKDLGSGKIYLFTPRDKTFKGQVLIFYYQMCIAVLIYREIISKSHLITDHVTHTELPFTTK